MNLDVTKRQAAIAAVLGIFWSSAILAILLAPSLPFLTPQPATQAHACSGAISEPAEGTTVVSIQGTRFGAETEKTPPRVVGFNKTGGIKWVHNPPDAVFWMYDVDPLKNGNLFITSTKRGKTFVYEYNISRDTIVWSETIDTVDTHDADLVGDGKIALANMRAYNKTTGRNHAGILIYDRETDSVVDSWEFADHYSRDVGGNYKDDWTHVNDIDALGDGRYLLSARNFDQTLIVNITSGEIEETVGAPGKRHIMNHQHNPQYLTSKTGASTLLVSDSDNNRIVEYEQRGDNWNKTWQLGVGGDFDWPRDADRLPNGNTLITDSKNDRVIEVTPTGEIVWEVYAPWLTYDVERIEQGDEAGGPTMSDVGAEGTYAVNGAANVTTEEKETCADTIAAK